MKIRKNGTENKRIEFDSNYFLGSMSIQFISARICNYININ